MPALAVLLASLPLLVHDALPLSSDSSYHLQWIRSASASFEQGTWYPRWVADCNDGYGAPIFVFYPPLASFGAGLLSRNPVEALRWGWVAWLAAAALSYYLSTRPLYGRPAAAAGACLYTLLPYHLFDLYDRGAFGEFVGLVWLPPLLALCELGPLTRRRWLVLVLVMVGLLLSHPMLALMAAVAWTGWAGGRLAWLRHNGVALLGASALALALSAFYWLPMLVETPRVQLEQHFSGDHYHWRRNLLFVTETDLGYQPDVCKPWATVAATTTLLLTLGGLALGTRAGRPWGTLSLLSFVLQTPLSVPIWEHLPWLSRVQFPWRFGALQMVGCCLLWSCLLKEHNGRRVWWVLAVLATPALLGAGATALRARPYTLTRTLAESALLRMRSVPEYTPVLQAGTSLDGTARCWGDGPLQGEVERWGEHQRVIRLRLQQSGRVWLRTLQYPGWRARLDRQPVPLLPGPLLSVNVGSGDHILEFAFETTLERRRAARVSLVALGIWLVILLGSRRP